MQSQLCRVGMLVQVVKGDLSVKRDKLCSRNKGIEKESEQHETIESRPQNWNWAARGIGRPETSSVLVQFLCIVTSQCSVWEGMASLAAGSELE